MGNSYAQVLHAHLLYPVSVDITSKFAHVGQKSIPVGLGGGQIKVTKFEKNQVYIDVHALR
jgi:hypothetical protein